MRMHGIGITVFVSTWFAGTAGYAQAKPTLAALAARSACTAVAASTQGTSADGVSVGASTVAASAIGQNVESESKGIGGGSVGSGGQTAAESSPEVPAESASGAATAVLGGADPKRHYYVKGTMQFRELAIVDEG